ncbi:pyridoxine 5'-phosphate oxidase C-terminal domain-containing protein [Microbacterium foliorum]|uniref:pyridoxine 5'-phosphate oxidase C-terminal domain-containing protein n=1 Tax=Rothia terrae TaxID=396015 RepID=UPI00343B0186
MEKIYKNNGEAVDFSENVPLIAEMEQLPESPWTIINNWISPMNNIADRTCVGTLSTVNSDNTVSSRTMNIKISDEIIFLATHRGSAKWDGDQNQKQASWHIYWPKLRRQINIRGTLVECSEELSEEWWNNRPASMDLVSTLSKQSKVAAKSELVNIKRIVERSDQNNSTKNKLPRPDNFIVLRLLPTEIEFWEGKFDRVHDRYLYKINTNNVWERMLLFP